jgi:hypothetical protein
MWYNSMHKAPVQSEFIASKKLYVNRKPLNWTPDFHIKQDPKIRIALIAMIYKQKIMSFGCLE